MSAYGIQFNGTGGARVIDGRRIIPHMIARYDMANYPYFDINEAGGAHPGWIMRIYSFDYPQAVMSRPHVKFWSVSTNGQDVYSTGFTVHYKVGTNFTAPILYIFALDSVAQSSDTWGMRMYGVGGSPLIYDAGNLHLNVHSLFNVTADMATGPKSTEYPTGVMRTFGSPTGTMPASPAITLPHCEIYRYYGTRFDGTGDWRASPAYRVRGASVDTLVLRNDWQYDEDETYSPAGYDNISKGNGNLLPIMVIDRSIYD